MLKQQTSARLRASQEGEFDTSTTVEAAFSASASPSPVRVLTPVLGAAATASYPCSRSLLTSFDPIADYHNFHNCLLHFLIKAFRNHQSRTRQNKTACWFVK
jgi:hypothetical protein